MNLMQKTSQFLVALTAIFRHSKFKFLMLFSSLFLFFSFCVFSPSIQANESNSIDVSVTVSGEHILYKPVFTVTQTGNDNNLITFSGNYWRAKNIQIHVVPLSADASPEQTYSYDVLDTGEEYLDWTFKTLLANGNYKAQIQVTTQTNELSPLSDWKNLTVYTKPVDLQPHLHANTEYSRITFSGSYENPLCLIFEITPIVDNKAQTAGTYTECLDSNHHSGAINWASITFLDPGQYQARVQIKLDGNVLSPWSNTVSFESTRIPAPDFSVSTDQETKNVTWDGQYSARDIKCLEVKIENLTDPGQYSSLYWPTGCTTGGSSNEIINSDSNGGHWWRFIQVLLPGQYQTQIRVTDAVGNASDWSSWKTFVVKSNLEAPKLTATINGNQVTLTGASPNGEACIWSELKNIETGEVFPQEVCQNITNGTWQILWQDVSAGSYVIRARLEQKNALQSPWSDWLGSFKVTEISQCLADGTGCEELVVIGEVKSATLENEKGSSLEKNSNLWRDHSGHLTPTFWVTVSLGTASGGLAIFGLLSLAYANMSMTNTFFYTPLVFGGVISAIPQVKIRAYDAKTGNLVKTFVSSNRGRLRIVLNQGSYRFKIDHGRGRLLDHLPKSTKIKNSVKKHLVLNNQVIKVPKDNSHLNLYFAIKFD